MPSWPLPTASRWVSPAASRRSRLEQRIPVVGGWAQFARAGNLMIYGPVFADVYRRLAFFVDKIRKGAKPGDLPVELPTKVELIVNLKTAKAIGIAIPPGVLARADEVIQ